MLESLMEKKKRANVGIGPGEAVEARVAGVAGQLVVRGHPGDCLLLRGLRLQVAQQRQRPHARHDPHRRAAVLLPRV